MIAEATRNARASANRFAEDSGSRVGAIIAEMGRVDRAVPNIEIGIAGKKIRIFRARFQAL